MTQQPIQTRQTKSDVHWGPRGTAGISFAAALEFQEVDCTVGNSHVLHNTSFETAPGEILCLLGESGSGKSTILRAAAGLQDIDSGRILINKRVMSAKNVTVPPDKRGIGLMFQDFALFPHLSILKNVEYGLKSLGREESRKQALHALKRVGLDSRADDYPSQLSGGQQQRLALARSIAPKPGLLLLDEPFSSLDARLRESVRAETLAVLRETQATCILVTHDPEEAMIFGDKIALLRDGDIAQIGTSDEIYNHPKDIDVARFFSPVSEIPTIVRGGVATTPFGNVDAGNREDGARVIVAMRPIGAVYIDSSGLGTPGRIVAKRDALGVDTLEVAVEGIDSTIRLRQPTNVNIRPGLDVNIAINPEHVLVFDAI